MISVFCLVQQLAMVEFESMRVLIARDTLEYLYMARVFDIVLKEIGDYQKGELLIVGDSLTSDIKGGNNAGILTCWYNPKKMENTKNEHVDFEIENLWELEQILEK